MDRIPSTPPPISPILVENRPLWSVMIPVYNGGTYLEETLESVLSEGYREEEMQIELIDDASTKGDI